MISIERRKVRTLDDVIAFLEEITERKLREFRTAYLVAAPAHGAAIDVDALDRIEASARAEMAAAIEDFKRRWPGMVQAARRELMPEMIY